MTEPPTVRSSARILKATALAGGVAVIVLVVAILPAEYGIDPLGTGRALGLTALSGATVSAPGSTPSGSSGPAEAGSAAPDAGPYKEDVFQVELRPFEGVEYKYRLEQGQSFIYTWTASAKVGYDFHGEPDGAPARYAESYAKGEATTARGGFTAAKPGIHGWFWENLGPTRVTVTLRTAGFYSRSTEYRDGERIERQFMDR